MLYETPTLVLRRNLRQYGPSKERSWRVEVCKHMIKEGAPYSTPGRHSAEQNSADETPFLS